MSKLTISTSYSSGSLVVTGAGAPQTIQVSAPGKASVVQLGTLSAAVNQQITQAVASATASASAANAAASTATSEAGVATAAAATATVEAAAAAASAAASANAYSAISNATSTDAGTLTGSETLPTSRGAGLLQTTLTKMANFVQTAFSWVAGSASRARTTQIRFLDLMSALEYCAGDGVTDDTAGLVAAEAAAYAGGKVLWLPSGYSFATNGQFACRVSIEGEGATLINTQAALSTSYSYSTLNFAGVAGIQVHGLTINSNSKCSGIVFNNSANCRASGMKILNTAGLAQGAYSSSGIHFRDWYVKGVIYPFTAFPTAGGAADCVYFRSCNNCSATDGYGEDFRRIGLVSEGDGVSADSTNNVFARCYLKYAHNCDDSSTEYNCAVWVEDSNSATVTDIVGDNISSGVGQTSGRVSAFTVGAGQIAVGTMVFSGCKSINNAAVMPAGYSLHTTSAGNYTGITVRDAYVENANMGISSLGGHSLTIENPTFRNMVYANSGHGGIVINATVMPSLTISKVNTFAAENTYAADSADINLYLLPSTCIYTLRDCKNGYLTHITRQIVAEQNLFNCNINYGYSTNYPSFRFAQLNVGAGCNFVQHANLGSFCSGLNVATWQMAGALWNNSAVNQQEISGVNLTLSWQNNHFVNTTWKTSPSASYLIDLEGNNWDGIDTNGAMKVGYANASPGEFYVRGGRVNSSNVAYVPFQKWNYNPTKGEITNVACNTTTQHNFTANVVQMSGGSVNGVQPGSLIPLTGIIIGTAYPLQWGSQAYMYSDASNAVSLRNGTSGQSFYAYGTYTDASNWERGVFATSGGLTIGTQQSGTGVARSIFLMTGGVNRWQLFSGGGAFAPVSNAGSALGASGQAISNIWQQGVLVNSGTVAATPSTGNTVTVANNTNCEIINPAGALAALTVQFPAPLGDGHTFEMIITQAITTLTLTPSSGATIMGGFTTTSSYSMSKWRYALTNTTWYRIG